MAPMKYLAATAGLLALATGTAPMPAFAKRELIYVSNIPAKHPTHVAGLDPYFARITEATNGSLTFKSYPGGTVAGGKTAVNAVQNGTADMALIADIYTPNELPVSTLTSDLAVLGKDARVMTGAVNQTLLIDCDPCRKDYLQHKVLPLASYSLTPYHFMCTKSPIDTADSVKGRKIRGTGSMGQLVAALGGTPVNITSGEIYEGLQRGQIDCTLGPVPWLRSYTLWDHAKFVTSSAVGTYHGTNFINIRTDTWRKLSAKEKKAMTDGLAHATRIMAQIYENDDASIQKEAERNGVSWTNSDPSLDSAVEQFRQNDVNRVIELASSRGVKNPQPIVDTFVANVEKWRKIVEGIGTGPWDMARWDMFEAALSREVFDKVKYP